MNSWYSPNTVEVMLDIVEIINIIGSRVLSEFKLEEITFPEKTQLVKTDKYV